ncbi:MAG: FAD-dependent oxidoreductase [Planctomycetota bacterium]
MKVIIIGNGAAGISAARTIRSINRDVNIAIISKDRESAYSLCALPYVISRELPRKYTARFDKDFYKKLKIQSILGSAVCKIIPEKKSVILQNGKLFYYDKLLIATGASPVAPRIEGLDKKGVFFLDTLQNTQKIMDYIKKSRVKKAIVIGAGFTGIESALALKKQGIEVVIVEMLDRILARILDKEMADEAMKLLVLNDSGADVSGVEVKLGVRVQKITGEKNVSGVRLDDNKLMTCDLVLVSIGVKPNLALLDGSGIKVNQGVEVDEYLQTNRSGIYAAGDAVETRDYLTGERSINAIWPNAIEQGRVAGLNMIEQSIIYEGADSINVLNMAGRLIISMGRLISNNQPDLEIISFRNQKSFRKVMLHNNTIVGFESIGPLRHHGFIWSCIKKKADISKIRDKILRDNFKPLTE